MGTDCRGESDTGTSRSTAGRPPPGNTLHRAAWARRKTNPACPSRGNHGTANDWRRYRCRCPEAEADMDDYRRREADKRRASRGVPPLEVKSPPDHKRAFPAIQPVGDVGRSVLHGARRPACREADPEWFFDPAEAALQIAKAICRGCPLVDDCLTHALRHESYGVWGGMTPEERDELRSARWADPPDQQDPRREAV